jgi:hypothetical protein
LEYPYFLAQWCSGLECRRLLSLELILLSSALPHLAIIPTQQSDEKFNQIREHVDSRALLKNSPSES